MQLQQNGNAVTGTVTIHSANMQAYELTALPCPTFAEVAGGDATSALFDGTASSSRLTFTDIGSNFWSLNFTTDLLQGIISNSEPGCFGIASQDAVLRRQ